MAERKDQKDLQLGNAAARAGALVRKLPSARRLLVATIGAATVQFATGCNRGSYVANLMAAPEMSGTGGSGARQGGAGGSGNGGGGNAGYYVSNLMAPPFVPQSGTGGRAGGGGVSGRSGSGGASGSAGTEPNDEDAGVEDAGQA